MIVDRIQALIAEYECEGVSPDSPLDARASRLTVGELKALLLVAQSAAAQEWDEKRAASFGAAVNPDLQGD